MASIHPPTIRNALIEVSLVHSQLPKVGDSFLSASFSLAGTKEFVPLEGGCLPVSSFLQDQPVPLVLAFPEDSKKGGVLKLTFEAERFEKEKGPRFGLPTYVKVLTRVESCVRLTFDDMTKTALTFHVDLSFDPKKERHDLQVRCEKSEELVLLENDSDEWTKVDFKLEEPPPRALKDKDGKEAADDWVVL